MTDNAARLRYLEKVQRFQQRRQAIADEPCRLMAIQSDLGKRVELLLAQGYTDSETELLIAEAERLKTSIAIRKTLQKWRIAFFVLMTVVTFIGAALLVTDFLSLL